MDEGEPRISMPRKPDNNQLEAAYPLIAEQLNCSQRKAYKLLTEIYGSFVDTAPPPFRGGLTHKQQGLMQYLQDHIDKYRHSPTYDEIAEARGYYDNSNANKACQTLEKRGWICRGTGQRSITILRRL